MFLATRLLTFGVSSLITLLIRS